MPQAETPRPRRRWRWLVLLTGFGLSGVMAAAATIIGAYYYVVPGLPAGGDDPRHPLADSAKDL